MNKYHAKKTIVDGIEFDSKKEANRYYELLLMKRCGIIKDLQLQVPFELIPKQDGERACKYIADFVYYDCENYCQVVEDVKGIKTDVYKIKRKLMLQVYGIKIKEV